MSQKFLNLAEVAKILACSTRNLRRLAHLKAIPAYRIGGMIKFEQDELLKWIQENKLKI